MLLDAETCPGWPRGLSWMVGGAAAYRRLFERLDAARRSVDIRAYIWRDDATGQALARALLAAAERGVHIRIKKSADAATHEWHEACGQSFLHKRLALREHVTASVLHGFYGARPKVARQRPSPLAEALRAHPRVALDCAPHHDHAKRYIIDDEVLLCGGMAIGDDAHFELIDHMVELTGPEAVARYRARQAGTPFDPERPWDFLINPSPVDDLRAQRLALLASARQRIQAEISFLGDPAFTDALCAAVERGVETRILVARRAGKLRWYNPQLLNEIRRRTGAPPHLHIGLHPRGVHSKLVVVDAARVDVGSANYTRLSHEGYGELNVHLNLAPVARSIAQVMDRHLAQARPALRRLRASRTRARLERHFMERAGRQASRAGDGPDREG